MSGSTNQAWEIASRQQPTHYTCFRCSQLSHQWMQEALASFPKGLPPAEQHRLLEQMTRDVDARVRAAVRRDTE